MRRFSLTAIGLLLVFSTPALAQDPTVIDSDKYKVEFENDHVRVLRITYGPGDKSVMHEHPDAVAVMLSGGSVRMHYPDGTTEDLESNDGDANWSGAVTHLPENIGDGRVEVILVELKSPEHAAEALDRLVAEAPRNTVIFAPDKGEFRMILLTADQLSQHATFGSYLADEQGAVDCEPISDYCVHCPPCQKWCTNAIQFLTLGSWLNGGF